MNEISVKCPICGTENHFFPSRIINIGVIACIKCGESLPLLPYDNQTSHDHQECNKKETQDLKQRCGSTESQNN